MALIAQAFGVVSGTLGLNHKDRFLIDQRIVGGLVTGSEGHLGRAPVAGAYSHLPILERAHATISPGAAETAAGRLESQTYLSASFQGASGSIIQALNACMTVAQAAAASAAVSFAEVNSALDDAGSTTVSIGGTAGLSLNGGIVAGGAITGSYLQSTDSADIAGDLAVVGTGSFTGVATFDATSVHDAGLSVKNGASSAGFVEFFEDSDNGTNKVTLIGPASTADVTITLPALAGHVPLIAGAVGNANVTSAEFLLLDGGSSIGTTAVAGGHGIHMNHGGTMAQTTVDTLDTYLAGTTKTLTNKTLTNPTINAATLTGIVSYTGGGARFGTTGSSNLYIAGIDANGDNRHYRLAVSGGMFRVEEAPT